jgi:hypothetical protein
VPTANATVDAGSAVLGREVRFYKTQMPGKCLLTRIGSAQIEASKRHGSITYVELREWCRPQSDARQKAAGSLSAARYFATVRRATGNPAAVSSDAYDASDR